MVLSNQVGDVFTNVEKVNKVYLMELRVIPPGTVLAAWTDEHREPYLELVQCLQKVVMAATARGGKGTEAMLMTWH